GGLRTLALTPATDRARLGRAIRALEPSAVVLCGRAPLDEVARLIFAVRSIASGVKVFDFRGAVPDTGASTVLRLGDSPTAARERLLAELDSARRPNPARSRPGFRTS